MSMDFYSGRQEILNVLKGVRAGDLPHLIHWMKTTSDFDEFTSSNDDVILRSIAEDLRQRLPFEAMLSSEQFAIQKLNQQTKPTIHIDAFLYDDDCIDSLCEEGKMSRNFCLTCGSSHTAPLEFISHSFSLVELKFLYQHVLPDLTGKVLVDVGSRLGAVLFGGYFYSSAPHIYGVEINPDFCKLQDIIISKYQLSERIKVLNADICTQAVLLQNADVVVMNNVFEYFLDRSEQARVWKFISENVRKKGSLLVTVPALENSLSDLQVDMQLSQWVEALPLHYDVFPEEDKEALEQIHLYRIL
uniref:Methyltransferase type 11 domain-containing protein n=1 Tax=Salvator merianae TaxID=96440 RepID=A0A8D0DN68_SALMN